MANKTEHEVVIYEDMTDWKVFFREKTALNHAAHKKHPRILKSKFTVAIVDDARTDGR